MGHGQLGPSKAGVDVSWYRAGVLLSFLAVPLAQVGLTVLSVPPHGAV